MPLTPDAPIAELFLELVAVPSPSGRERAVGELVQAWLAHHGVDSDFDDAGAASASDAGNLIATVVGAHDAPVYLFVAHMDTVESGTPPISPRLDDDGVIRSAGETILGADNKAAVAAVMRLCAAAARLPCERRPTLRAAFTCREESGRMGASLLDRDLVQGADCAFCVDGARPIGTVITRALGQTVFGIIVHGRAAHAAAHPEAGVSAIRAAAEIVAALPLGRQPGGGSVSVAAIAGGSVIDRLSPAALGQLGVAADADGPTAVSAAIGAGATNSVPDLALVRGEVRGYSVAEIEDTVQTIVDAAQRVCDQHGATYEWVRDRGRMVPPFPGSGPRGLELIGRAVAAVPGVQLVTEGRHATLEANYLAADTDVVAVASGGRDPHQPSESIPAVELERLEALLLAIVSDAGVAGAA